MNPLNHPPSNWPDAANALIHARRTTLPKRLQAPGPSDVQLHTIMAAACAAPDHGQLLPWRFVQVPEQARVRLGEVFAQALLERDATATPEQQDQAREKAFRAPTLLLLVVDSAFRGAATGAEIGLHERLISAGCAVQNILLMATALGFGSSLTSGKAIQSTTLRAGFALHPEEHAVCFVNLGQVASQRSPRARPTVVNFLSTWGAASA